MGRLFMHHIGLKPLILLGLMLAFFTKSAYADIWAFIDERGLAHFASEPVDERYELYFKGNERFWGKPGARRASLAARRQASARAPGPAPSRLLTYFEISPAVRAVKHHLRAAARNSQVDAELLQAIIATESGFDARVVSPRGAVGLMQLMPATAKRFGVRVEKRMAMRKKLIDPATNIKAGSAYLRHLLTRFADQPELAVAAYNAGEGAVRRSGNRIPNYKETQNYVKTVMQLYRLLKPPAQLLARRAAPNSVRLAHRGHMTRADQPLAWSSASAPLHYSDTP